MHTLQRTAVFTFARMSPPTAGHELLVNKVLSIAEDLSADKYLFLSQRCDSSNNPLEWQFKVDVCKAAFPHITISNDPDIKTPYQALEYLADTYPSTIMVVGSDRVSDFTSMYFYAEKWHINFSLVQAGTRDTTDTVLGISSTQLRTYAMASQVDQFYRWLPSKLDASMKQDIYLRTRAKLVA